jgi:phage terminase large subunit-like protein
MEAATVRRSTGSTSSRRGAGSAPLRPFSVDHFRRYAEVLLLDSGEHWQLEGFQAEIVGDIFAGHAEVWAVVPEGNAKTTLLGGLALYHGDYTDSAFVPIGASSREQAEIMYRQAEGFVLRTPELAGRFKCQEGYRRIKCLRTGGRIQVYAADDRTADGVIPTLAILDELHRHRDLRLYRTWRGKLDKRGGQIVAISTAGEPGSEFEETRDQIRRHATDIRVAATRGRLRTIWCCTTGRSRSGR